MPKPPGQASLPSHQPTTTNQMCNWLSHQANPKQRAPERRSEAGAPRLLCMSMGGGGRAAAGVSFQRASQASTT